MFTSSLSVGHVRSTLLHQSIRALPTANGLTRHTSSIMGRQTKDEEARDAAERLQQVYSCAAVRRVQADSQSVRCTIIATSARKQHASYKSPTQAVLTAFWASVHPARCGAGKRPVRSHLSRRASYRTAYTLCCTAGHCLQAEAQATGSAKNPGQLLPAGQQIRCWHRPLLSDHCMAAMATVVAGTVHGKCLWQLLVSAFCMISLLQDVQCLAAVSPCSD